MARHGHGDPLGDPGVDQVPDGRPAKVVPQHPRAPGLATRLGPSLDRAAGGRTGTEEVRDDPAGLALDRPDSLELPRSRANSGVR